MNISNIPKISLSRTLLSSYIISLHNSPYILHIPPLSLFSYFFPYSPFTNHPYLLPPITLYPSLCIPPKSSTLTPLPHPTTLHPYLSIPSQITHTYSPIPTPSPLLPPITLPPSLCIPSQILHTYSPIPHPYSPSFSHEYLN